MKIWVARHADAGPEADDPAEERERGLTDLGVKTAKRVARAMKARVVQPKVILASDYARTAEMADILGKVLGVKVSFVDTLSPHVPAHELVRDLLRDKTNSRRVLLVGHHDNLVPSFCDLGGKMGRFERPGDDFEIGDFPDIAKGEVRRLSVDRDSGKWACRDRIRPDDFGLPLLYE